MFVKFYAKIVTNFLAFSWFIICFFCGFFFTIKWISENYLKETISVVIQFSWKMVRTYTHLVQLEISPLSPMQEDCSCIVWAEHSMLVVGGNSYLSREATLSKKCPGGHVVSAPELGPCSCGFEFRYRRNSARDFMMLYCTEPFNITLPTSWYDLDNVERYVMKSSL